MAYGAFPELTDCYTISDGDVTITDATKPFLSITPEPGKQLRLRGIMFYTTLAGGMNITIQRRTGTAPTGGNASTIFKHHSKNPLALTAKNLHTGDEGTIVTGPTFHVAPDLESKDFPIAPIMFPASQQGGETAEIITFKSHAAGHIWYSILVDTGP